MWYSVVLVKSVNVSIHSISLKAQLIFFIKRLYTHKGNILRPTYSITFQKISLRLQAFCNCNNVPKTLGKNHPVVNKC